jgi:hypothetical protein
MVIVSIAAAAAWVPVVRLPALTLLAGAALYLAAVALSAAARTGSARAAALAPIACVVQHVGYTAGLVYELLRGAAPTPAAHGALR